MEDSDFKKPSVAEGPRTWWHWNNGHVAREGITADLKARVQCRNAAPCPPGVMVRTLCSTSANPATGTSFCWSKTQTPK